MNPGINQQPFSLNIKSEWFTKGDILSTSSKSTPLQVLKNYDRENKNKSKEWKKILKKLNVKLKTGMLVKLVK